MTAGELINDVVAEEYRDRAHIRAMLVDKEEVIDNDTSWFHVHRNEELPDDYPVIVYVRV